MKVTTASAVLVTFYTLLLLVYLRPVDRRAVAEPQQSLARAPAPQTPAPHEEPPGNSSSPGHLESDSGPDWGGRSPTGVRRLECRAVAHFFVIVCVSTGSI